MLLALRRGWRVGAGAVYGLVNLAVNPLILDPVQALFDYPPPFAALGLAGLFRPTLHGAVLGTVGRFVLHFVSGVGFALYAPEGWNPASTPPSTMYSTRCPGCS